MAYVYKFKGFSAQLMIALDTANINNIFVQNTCRGFGLTSPQATGDQAHWIMPYKLQNTTGFVSPPMKLYNPYFGVYLANTEQVMAITNANNNGTGMLSGAVDFASADLAPSFVFAYQPNTLGNYKIYMSDTTDADVYTSKNRLMIDKANSNRVMLTTSSFNVGAVTDDVFFASQINL